MIIHGDATQIPLADNSVDTCITDPPYHLTSIIKRFGKENSAPAKYGTDGVYARASAGFMGKTWDGGDVAFNPETWTEVYRVLKPGALLLSFGGTRTYHRMVCAIEDAGFEIRDTIAWVYGSGFPKSYDISKGIDKKAGAKREVVGWNENLTGRTRPEGNPVRFTNKANGTLTAPSTPEAQLWHGWGTALKPAFEPIVVAMKPIDGNFVNNALTWGVAGLNIDGGRVETSDKLQTLDGSFSFNGTGGANETGKHIIYRDAAQGRFPANLIHDGSDEVVELFPQTKSGKVSAGTMRGINSNHNVAYADMAAGTELTGYGDSGSAARFFYCAKASRSERNAGLEGMEEHLFGQSGGAQQALKNGESEYLQDSIGLNKIKKMQNHHPTVKPLELMRYLVRLTKTPTGGVVLDPFMGSGTTGCACVLEGRDFIGIEKEAEYVEIAEKRIAYWSKQPKLPVE